MDGEGQEDEAAEDGEPRRPPMLAIGLIVAGLTLVVGIAIVAVAMPVHAARAGCGSALLEDRARLEAISDGEEMVIFVPSELYGDDTDPPLDEVFPDPEQLQIGTGVAVAAQLEIKCDAARHDRQTVLLLALVPGILLATAGWMVLRSSR